MYVLQLIMRLSESYSLQTLRPMSSEIRELASDRLTQNGLTGFTDEQLQMLRIIELQVKLQRNFLNVRRCFNNINAREDAFFFWDLNRVSHPLLFERGFGTGAANHT